jgi:hypothetical protein
MDPKNIDFELQGSHEQLSSKLEEIVVPPFNELKELLAAQGTHEFAIEGHDGAGKSTVIKAVISELEQLGLSVQRARPFFEVNQRRIITHLINQGITPSELPVSETAKIFFDNKLDVYYSWSSPAGAMQAITELSAALGVCRLTALEKKPDVIIYDRHWLTVHTELRDKSLPPELWSDVVPTFFIGTPPERTLQNRTGAGAYTSSEEAVLRYHRLFVETRDSFITNIVGDYNVLTNEQPFTPIVNSITARIADLVRAYRIPSLDETNF